MRLKQPNADWREVYERFMRSPAWRAKRARIMKRARDYCEACLEKHATEIHHTVYPSPMTIDALTNQPNWQLRAVCQDCHDHVHGRPIKEKPKAKWVIS